MEARRLCAECATRRHSHEGRCQGTAYLIFRSAAGPTERPVRCECEEVGSVDADTQVEVALR